MDVQTICAVLLRYADEVEPLKKQLEHVSVAIDEDHTTVASPRLVLCALRPVERQPGNEEIPWTALPELCAGTPAHMLLPLLRATPVGVTCPASGGLVEDDVPRTSNGRTLHIRDPRAHGSLGCPRRPRLRRLGEVVHSEAASDLGRRGVCRLPARLGVGDRQVGTERDDFGVGDACPPQPLIEVWTLEVDAERVVTAVAVHAARVDDDRLLVGHQPDVA